MIDLIILIGCIIASGFIGYTAGYNYGFDDGVLYQVQKQIDERRKQLKNESSNSTIYRSDLNDTSRGNMC